MILDDGICTVYAQVETSDAGEMPVYTDGPVRTASYYKELSFETSPSRPTEKREETQTAARARILQCTGIKEGDIAELEPFGNGREKMRFRIRRAYHGLDEQSGDAITDLTLEEAE